MRLRPKVLLVLPVAALLLLSGASPSSAARLPSSAPGGDVKTSTLRAHCTILGTAGDDVLTGTSGDDVICGFGGNDVINGAGGSDRIFGGPGDDRIKGGPGADYIVGGSGADVLSGGPGGDAIAGGPGDDAIDGGSGEDQTVDGGVGELDTAWSVGLRINYNLPKGSTIVWTLIPNSGKCISALGGFTHVADGKQQPTNLFNVPGYDFWESCYWTTSYGAWNYQVTTPSGFSRGGNLAVETGAANILVHRANAGCAYTNPGLSCTGGSAT
ncbi:MAG: calcium-binding protein, partial [bacterium]|nr:calcium-binding protein [bacterium]